MMSLSADLQMIILIYIFLWNSINSIIFSSFCMLPDTVIKISCINRFVTNTIVTLVDGLRTGNHGLDIFSVTCSIYVSSDSSRSNPV